MATFQPTQFEDGGSGSGSLRDLILQANASGEDTIIELQSGGVFTLSIENGPGTLGEIEDEDAGLTGDLDIVNFNTDSTLTIRGLGEGATIDAGGIDRVFDVVSDTVLNDGFITYGSQLILENVTITGGSAGGPNLFDQGFAGGGIRVQSQSTLTATNSNITGNTAAFNNGGGLANSNGFVGLDNVTITDNTALGGETSQGDGGGLFSDYGNTVVENSTISGNTAAGSGGGLSHVEGGTLTINNSTIENNSASFAGGGVGNNDPLVNEGTLNITESTITGNTASMGGGVFSSGAGSITGSTIENNVATSQGGGVATGGIPEGGEADFNVIDSFVRGNTASQGGGVFVDTGGINVDVVNSTIEFNQATGEGGFGEGFGGGGIGGSGGRLFVYNSEVRNNASASSGGGIGVAGTATSVANSTVADNSAASFGGGISFISNAFVAFSTISGNTAGSSGGGISAASGGVSYSTTIANSTIADNTANGNGGGIEVAGGLSGVAYYDNGTAYYGVSGFPTDATIANTTIVGNVADADNDGAGNGGGVFIPPLIVVGTSAQLPGTVSLQNSIIAENDDTPSSTGSGAIAPDISGPVRGNNNNLLTSTQGIDEVDGEPEQTIGGPNDLVVADPGLGPLADNPGGDTQTIALLPGSPAIDAGDNGAIAVDFFDADDDGDFDEPVPFEQRFTGADADIDFSGLPRIGGAAVDIGAFEFDSTSPVDPGPPDDTPADPDPDPNPEPPDDTPVDPDLDPDPGLPDDDPLNPDPPDDSPGDPGTPDSSSPGSLNVDGVGDVVPSVDVLNIFRVLAGAPQAVVIPDGANVSQQEIVNAANALSNAALDVDGSGTVEASVDVLNIFRVLAGAPQAVVIPDGASASQQDVVNAVNDLLT